jgi:hypothetical protein
MKAGKAAYRPAGRVVLIAALILMVPFVAMQVTDQVNWSLFDFVVAGALLVGTGLLYELAARKARTVVYRAAAGVAVGAAFVLTWVNLAVGIIGEPDERANVLYLAVPAVGIIGAVIARLEPRGMARALFATALAQALIAAIALILGWGAPGTGSLAIVALNGMFVALFAGSAWLFRLAARANPPASAAAHR